MRTICDDDPSDLSADLRADLGWAPGASSLRRERARRAAVHRFTGQHQSAGLERLAKELPPLARTDHGRARAQQRGIRPEAIELVLACGRERRSYGVARFFMDRAAVARASRDFGVPPDAVPRIQVLVSDGGALITVAHRTKRLRR